MIKPIQTNLSSSIPSSNGKLVDWSFVSTCALKTAIKFFPRKRRGKDIPAFPIPCGLDSSEILTVKRKACER